MAILMTKKITETAIGEKLPGITDSLPETNNNYVQYIPERPANQGQNDLGMRINRAFRLF
jgi:hypothetical protein